MITIHNNTDLAIPRLLALYNEELRTVWHLNIVSITFDCCKCTVFGIDCILLEIDEN